MSTGPLTNQGIGQSLLGELGVLGGQIEWPDEPQRPHIPAADLPEPVHLKLSRRPRRRAMRTA